MVQTELDARKLEIGDLPVLPAWRLCGVRWGNGNLSETIAEVQTEPDERKLDR